jgi:YgiT-type zinc finger domain-containing protein
MNCPICNKKMEKSKEPYSYKNIELGKFEAEKCKKCNEIFFTETSSDEIDKKAKQHGLWGLEQHGTIGYSGNSIIVRIPKKIAKFLNFKQGKEVNIRPEGKTKLVVEMTT